MARMNRLMAYMALRGYNQTTLAKALDLSPATICQKLDGDINFSVKQIKRIIKVLRIPMKDVGPIFFEDLVGRQITKEVTDDGSTECEDIRTDTD